MRYIKKYEGFRIDQLQSIETSVRRFKRNINNKINNNSDKLINYDISNFRVLKQYGTYKIYPDNGFMKLYKNYCNLNNLEYNEKLEFECSILPYDDIKKCYNLIDSMYLVPDDLQGLSLGYKIYKLLLNNIEINYIMGLSLNSDKAKNLWFNLLLDDEVYSGTNSEFNIIIRKNIPDDILFNLLDKIEELNLKYDDDLNGRIYNR